LNESVHKAAEEARAQMRQELEVDLTAKLRAQFKDEWNQKEATLQKEFDVEKAAMKKKISKVKKVPKKIWSFISVRSQVLLVNPFHWTPMNMMMMMIIMMRPNRSNWFVYITYLLNLCNVLY